MIDTLTLQFSTSLNDLDLHFIQFRVLEIVKSCCCKERWLCPNLLFLFLLKVAPQRSERPTRAPSLSLSSAPPPPQTEPILVLLNSDRCRPRRVECRPVPFSSSLSFRRSVLWYSGLSLFRKFLKPLNTSTLSSCRPDVMSAVPAGLFAGSFPLTPAWPGQKINRSFFSAEDCSRMAVCQSGQPIPDATFYSRFFESENGGMCSLCVAFRGEPLWCVCDCFCIHGHTADRDSVGTPVLMYSPSTLNDREPTTRPVPCDWAVS